MDFYHWFLQLHTDCVHRGIASRLRLETIATWLKVWQAGVAPSFDAVCEWATQDPERFADLRETELEVFTNHRIAA
jgi:hypothetical protein